MLLLHDYADDIADTITRLRCHMPPRDRHNVTTMSQSCMSQRQAIRYVAAAADVTTPSIIFAHAALSAGATMYYDTLFHYATFNDIEYREC